MKIIERIQHKLFVWILNKLYSDGLFKPFSFLDPSSKAFELEYEEERYKLIKQLPLEDIHIFMKLMALNVNYLGRKSHSSFDNTKNILMKGRVMQATYEYALLNLVYNVKVKEDIGQQK